jgi:hypothetical protein
MDMARKNSLLQSCDIGELISDHNCIYFKLNILKHNPGKKIIKFRKTKSMNIEKFKKDLTKHLNNKPVARGASISYLNHLIDFYNSTIQVLNNNAPEVVLKVRERAPTPWSHEDIIEAKREKRKAEKKWKRSHNQVDFDTYKEKRNTFNNHHKSQDLSKKIQGSKGNSRAMFKLINSSLNRKQDLPLPIHTNETDMANKFNEHFINKVNKIRADLDTQTDDDYDHKMSDQIREQVFEGDSLNNFEPLTAN